MSASAWKVIGASGFVGSAVLTRLRALNIDTDPIEAPRLLTKQTTARGVIEEARKLEGIIDSLADSFAGADVVINASGIAAPNLQELPPLMGANALLPAIIAIAAQRTGVRRVIHLSSSAVQGSQKTITDSRQTHPFSAYSFSKATGEEVLLTIGSYLRDSATAGKAPGASSSQVATYHAVELCILRATSVQGAGRRTTAAFAKIASSPLASVAGKGHHPSPVSSSYALADFVARLGQFDGQLPEIVVQPWEETTCESVLIDAGRRRPLHLPRPLCALAIKAGYAISEALNDRFQGTVRRVEVMWFGQEIDDSWARSHRLVPEPRISEVLRNAHRSLGKASDQKFNL